MRIIYYDFAALAYSSFFVNGFIDNEREFGYRFSLSRRVPSIVRDNKEMQGPWTGLLASIMIFEVVEQDRTSWFCIDGRDGSRRGVQHGEGYHVPLLERVDRYFKVNYVLDDILADPVLEKYKAKIVPAAPFFPLRVPLTRTRLPRLWPVPSAQGHQTSQTRR